MFRKIILPLLILMAPFLHAHEPEPKQPIFSYWKNLVVPVIGRGAAEAVFYPMDTVIIQRQQYQTALKDIIKLPLLSFYKGFMRYQLFNIPIAMPLYGAYFWACDALKDETRPYIKYPTAAIVAGTTLTTVMTPLELWRVRQKDSLPQPSLKNPFEWYRGWLPAMGKNVGFSMFSVALSQILHETTEVPLLPLVLPCSMIAQVIISPMDMLKTRMMGDMDMRSLMHHIKTTPNIHGATTTRCLRWGPSTVLTIALLHELKKFDPFGEFKADEVSLS